jgi:hypothetical protein
MEIKVIDIRDKEFSEVLQFYAENGDEEASFYKYKLQSAHDRGALIGKLCVTPEDDKIIGAYLGVDQPLLCNPMLKAAQSIDTLVSPEARGKGVIRKVAREYYTQLRALGYDSVYGLPNKKIEGIRFGALGWNESRLTYRYFVPIPIPLLKLGYLLFSYLGPSYIRFSAREEDLNLSKVRLSENKDVHWSYFEGLLKSSYKKGLFEKVGAVRAGQYSGMLGKLAILCALAARSKGLFLMTYATAGSETGHIFSAFSIKQEGLKFSGMNLISIPNYSFGEVSFEFVEFDTFGLI